MDPSAALELQQLHEYIRHEAGVYFAWFSFFLTILFGAMGWSLKASLDKAGSVRFPAVFFCMLFLFVAQLCLAIAATCTAIKDVRTAETRVVQLLPSPASGAESAAVYVAKSPVPSGYLKGLELARWALLVNLIFWPIVGLVVLTKWKANKAIAAPTE